MKTKLQILIVLLLLSVTGINAQSNLFYYYKGQRVYLTPSKRSLTITVSQHFEPSLVSELGFEPFEVQEHTIAGDIVERYARLNFESFPDDVEYFQKINSLRQTEGIKNVAYFISRGDVAPPVGTSNIFYVRLKEQTSVETLQSIANQKNVQVVSQVPHMPDWYIMRVEAPNNSTSIEMSNQFFETGHFEEVDPAFMFHFRANCTNDPLFSNLWGLQNSSNPGYDINVCPAWNITQGAGINVAILDTGIEKTHNDLAANIHPLSFNTLTGTSPSGSVGHHGTHVAGTVAAVKDNNLQVVGVAPQSKLMSVSHSLALTPTVSAQLASGISWSWQNGADVINNSWGDQGGQFYGQLQSTILENAIINAMTQGRNGKGTIVVFASGNFGNSGAVMDYPGNFHSDILAVGSITDQGYRSSFSGYGNALDVVAPGSNILSTTVNNGTSYSNGTSMAAPHVTGIVALVLSVNPCLSGAQVRDIIESTSKKIRPGTYTYANHPNRPNGTWNIQMGYGLVDALAAVQLAQQMHSPTLDLYVKDSHLDMGIEPNSVTQYMWTSDNIWVRVFQDNGMTHQNPDYSPSNPNYVYVRVINKSCVASTGNEQLRLYWAKAATSLAWPQHWDGSLTIFNPALNQNVPFGGQIGSLSIPVLQPGEEAILEFPWMVPNPNDYNGINSEPWHFCLLTRIVAANDPMTFPETSDLNGNVRNNNNIAWKNVTVVDVISNATGEINIGGVVAVGNPFDEPREYALIFLEEDTGNEIPVYEAAEVTVKMDEKLYESWMMGGAQAENLFDTGDEFKRIVGGSTAVLHNIVMEGNQISTLNLAFNFYSDNPDYLPSYTYHIVQRDLQTGEIIGGETYAVNKPNRPYFKADAGGDREADMHQEIVLAAVDIEQEAQYNWYDMEGNLLHEGIEFPIYVTGPAQYKLEVIRAIDGFKDYDEVNITIRPSRIESISPNPSSDSILVYYKLNCNESAQLVIVGYYGGDGAMYEYNLEIGTEKIQVDVSHYTSGFYSVILICDGVISDAKTLVKQ